MNPDYDRNGLPLHADSCPEYDGKRCKLQGFRPDRFCEPALIDARTQMLAAIQLGAAQCTQVQDALRRTLPMAEAWFRHEFDHICDHEPGECTCDREAHAKTDINIALAALEKKVAP